MPSLPVLSAMSCSAQAGEPDDAGALVDEDQLVAARREASREQAGHGRAEHEARVGRVVDRQQRGGGGGVGEQRGHVDPRQGAGHQAEGGEGRVAAADVGVGRDDAQPGLVALLLQGRAGVGHDHDVVGGLEAGLDEGVLEGAALGVGLDRGAGLRGDHDHGAAQVAGERGADLVGVAGVQHHQVDALGGADDLRRQRGAAHAAQHDAGQPLLAAGVDDGPEDRQQRPGRLGQPHPGQALGRLVLGLGAPQRVVAGEEPAGELLLDEARHVLGDGPLGLTRRLDRHLRAHDFDDSICFSTVPVSSCQEATNFSTPSFSRAVITSS